MEKTALEKKYPSIDFGEEFDKTKKKLCAFNEKLSKFKSTLNDLSYYKSEYFLELRTQIELDRKLSKEKIDDHFDKLIKQLDEIEKDNKSKKSDENHEETIKQFESDFKKLKDEINIPKIDYSKWNKIRSESIDKIGELNLLLENYKIEILGNQKITFQSIQDELGDLLDENTIEKTSFPSVRQKFQKSAQFSFSVKDFNSIKRKGIYLFSEEYCLNDIKWSTFFLKKNDKFEWYLYPTNMEDFEYIDALIEMKFLCSETSVDIIQEFTHKFDRKIMEKADYQGYGPDDFIEFKKIFENDIYDKENDCIHCILKIIINDMKKNN